MKYSDNYNLNLPESTDFYNVDDFNENFEMLDEKVASKADSKGGDIADTIVTFDDSGETEDITSFTEFLSSLVSGLSIAKFFCNLKAGLQYVLHVGSIVNNCVTDNSELPLSAAMGKELQDQITELNSDLTLTSKVVTVTYGSNSGSLTLYKYGRVVYAFLTLVISGHEIDTPFSITGTVPDAFLPIDVVRNTCALRSSNLLDSAVAYLSIDTSGNITITMGTTDSRQISESLTWISAS